MVTLHPLFSPDMVLQSGSPVRFHGTASPEERFKAFFAGESRVIQADASGLWMAEFSPLEKGYTQYQLVLKYENGTEICHIDGIVAGEVWLCAGQSNMAMPVYSDNPYFRLFDREYEQVFTEADTVDLRFFNAAERSLDYDLLSDGTPKSEPVPGAAWQKVSRQNVGGMSAVAYYFGRKLERELHCPIGLIVAAQGSSRIVSWISRKSLELLNNDEVNRLFRLRDSAGWPEKLAGARKESRIQFQKWLARFHAKSAQKNEDRQSVSLPCEFPQPGRYLLHARILLPDDVSKNGWRLRCGLVNDCDEVFFNGMKIGETSPETPFYWRLQRDYSVPPELIRSGENQVEILADNHFGKGMIQGKNGTILLESPVLSVAAAGLELRTVFVWNDAVDGKRPAPSRELKMTTEDFDSFNFPANLFDTVIAPLRYGCFRGVLWYQGESDAGNKQYGTMLSALIDDWRRLMQDSRLPFFVLQLPGFYRQCPAERLSAAELEKLPPELHPPWAELREIQEKTVLSKDNAWLVPAVDAGDPCDIHPRDKQTPALRFAASVLQHVYQFPVRGDAPYVENCEMTDSGTIRLTFANAPEGLCTSDGRNPGGFAVLDDPERLIRVPAKIESNGVTVFIPPDTHPVELRYCYAAYDAAANLWSRDGLPVLPFRKRFR